MLQLNWAKRLKTHDDFELQRLILTKVKAKGVYVIWVDSDPGQVVRIGQGNVSERLQAHRNDPEITQYEELGTLRVTWANVPSHLRDGVESYLADQYPPLVGDAFPDADLIAVNSPW